MRAFELVPKLRFGNPGLESYSFLTELEARASKGKYPNWSLGTRKLLMD